MNFTWSSSLLALVASEQRRCVLRSTAVGGAAALLAKQLRWERLVDLLELCRSKGFQEDLPNPGALEDLDQLSYLGFFS